MTRKLTMKMFKDPGKTLNDILNQLHWGWINNGITKRNKETTFGMIIGNDIYTKLVHSYLPNDFHDILEKKLDELEQSIENLKKKETIEEANIVEENKVE